MNVQRLSSLTDQQIRDYFDQVGILYAGLLTKQQLIQRYIDTLNLAKGGAKIIVPPRVAGPIGSYPATDMRY